MAENEFKASVIICVKNGGSGFSAQLEAIAEQESVEAYEVIIVDNGSSDDSLGVAEYWAKNVDIPIKIFSQPDLKGIPSVRNFAVQQAAGEIILFCDADDQVSPRWIQAYLDKFKGGKMLAGGLIEAYHQDGSPAPNVFPRGLMQSRYLPHVGNCNCAINRSLFFEVGGYDESLPVYGFEDVDLSWRVQEAGYPIEYVEEAKISFSLSNSSVSLKKKFLLGKGRVLMARRYPKYDDNFYSVADCFVKVFSAFRGVLIGLFREKNLNRRALSVLVSSCGNLYGALYYSGSNKLPARKLLEI